MEGIRHIEINKKPGDGGNTKKKDEDDSEDDDSYRSHKSYNSADSNRTTDSSRSSSRSSSHSKSENDMDQNTSDSEKSDDGDDNKKIDMKSENEEPVTKANKSVNFDSLLKAVIEINDKIEDKERQLKNLAESSKSSKHHRDSRNGSRPKTAVLQYRDESEYSHSFDGNESDLETSPSIISRASSSKRRLHSASTRGPHGSSSPGSRMNMSFSNEKVRSIDAENQRLLKNLLHTKTLPKVPAVIKKKPQPRVQSASLINRSKRQQEIEGENLRFLHRLQSVKPSNGLSRNTLLSDHSKHEQYSGRIGRASRPSSAVSYTSPCDGTTLRSRPQSGFSSNYFDDTASISSSTSTRSQRATRERLTRENLERQNNWNDRW